MPPDLLTAWYAAREATRPPKRAKRGPARQAARNAVVQQVADVIWRVFPERPEPAPFVPFRRAILDALAGGAHPGALIRAALAYAAQVRREQTEPRYRFGLVRFYRDDLWRQHAVPRVEGRTREEWARSGQDVAGFDAQATGADAAVCAAYGVAWDGTLWRAGRNADS